MQLRFFDVLLQIHLFYISVETSLSNPKMVQIHIFISLNLFKLNSFGQLLKIQSQAKLAHILKKYPTILFFLLNIINLPFLLLTDLTNNHSTDFQFFFILFNHFYILQDSKMH